MMKISRIKVRSALAIKLKNTLDSSAIKVMLLIVLVISIATSFLPFFYNSLFQEEVILATNAPLVIGDSFLVKSVGNDGDDVDIIVEEQGNRYVVRVLTSRGRGNYQQVVNSILSVNREIMLSSGMLSEEDISLLLGGNIELVMEYGEDAVEDSVVNFIMMLTLIFFLTMTLLTTRIGVQVAAEKGKKVTETILTSITREQLFFSQAMSGVIVTAISFLVISLPIIAAYFIDDPKITTDFSFFSSDGLLVFLLHLILVSSTLVIASIAIGSAVKHTEDANIMTVIVLIPMLISYIYYVLTLNLFEGMLSFLNYIPIFSVFPVFGAILLGAIPHWQTAVFCCLDVVLFFIVYGLSRRVYCKNI